MLRQLLLKIHAQRTHGIRTEKQQIFDRAAHSVGGLPTCKFCNKQFSRWQTLAHHINSMACPIFEPPTNPEAQSQVQSADIPQPTENHPERALVQLPTEAQPDAPPVASQLTAQRIARKGLRFFIPYKTLGRHLQQHCAQCGQWTATTRVMKLHYRNSHPELFPKLAVNIASLIERCATPSIRCHYCDLVHQDWRAHVRKCTSVWQFAVLCIIQDPGNAVRRKPDQEMAEFFGTVKPPPASLAPGAMADSTKRRRETEQVHGRWADWEPAQWNPRGRYQGHRTSGRDPLVLSLARLALRHEEEIRLLQQDTTLVVQPGAGLSTTASLSNRGGVQEATTVGTNLGIGDMCP